jgi:hypothetical protein
MYAGVSLASVKDFGVGLIIIINFFFCLRLDYGCLLFFLVLVNLFFREKVEYFRLQI